MTTSIFPTQQIFATCLRAYNEGTLHGAWIEVEGLSEDELMAEIQAKVLATSPANEDGLPCEEFFITDHEGLGEIGEYESLGSLVERSEFIAEVGDEALAVELIEHFDSVSEAKRCFDENYMGCYKSLAEYAEDHNDYPIPESIAYYIDYKKMGEDMEMSGDIFTIETALDEVHVFSR